MLARESPFQSRTSTSKHDKMPSRRSSSYQTAAPGSSVSPLPPTPLHHRSMSTASSVTRTIHSPEQPTLAKEKEFMANARILALSNLIDSITVPQAKQGYYGKQLKIIGSTLSPTASSGAELDITVKIHVLEDTWTTCPLLAPSTVLHRWKVDYLSSSTSADNERAQTESVSDMIFSLDEKITDLMSSLDEKRSSWTHPAGDTVETISPSASPTHQQQQQQQQLAQRTHQRHSKRPISVASMASYATQSVLPETHIAVLNNALSLVANKAGDYLVHLSIHVPLVAGANSPSIHLLHIPKCRSNFIKFQIGHEDDQLDIKALDLISNASGLEFNVYPAVAPLDEAHLNPESDEDAEFWLEAQELLVGRHGVVEKLTTTEIQQQDSSFGTHNGLEEEESSDRWQFSGCFPPTSSLHIAWIPQDAPGFVLEAEHDIKVDIKGLPDGPKSSSLLKDRRRKDPEENHQRDRLEQDDEEGSIVYEHLEMDDGDLVISVESDVTVHIRKLGWKQPYAELLIPAPSADQGQSIDASSVDITGVAVQDWELLDEEQDDLTESDETAEFSGSLRYKIWFHAGTEGKTDLNIRFNICQAVAVGCGKDILCSIPRMDIIGADNVKGRLQVHTGHSLAIQRTNTRNLQLSLADAQLVPESHLALRLQSALHFQFQSYDYDLTVVAQRYQPVPRIARIERIRAEIGVSSGQQPGFARVTMTNVILPQQNDRYLRIHQLERAEIWNVMVNGNQCSKLIQFVDKRLAGLRTVLVPIPGDSLDDAERPHQVEISYGFPTATQDVDGSNSSIELVVPAVNLPVGEYMVVASLPRLPDDLIYDAPTGDFEVVSSEGLPNQRKTITYGAYMTLGRPQLKIATVPAPVVATVSRIHNGDLASSEHAYGTASDIVDAVLEQISRTPGQNTIVAAHHPQQPPYNATVVASTAAVAHPPSQRHPQQPLEPQNPQAEQTSTAAATNGPISITTSNISVLTDGSGLTPQIRGSAQGASPPVSTPMKRAITLVQTWWKQAMAPIVALLLVVMIINVAAFQETRITSLDLVGVPMWKRPLAAIGQLWHGSGIPLTQSPRYMSQQQLWEESRDHEDYDMPVMPTTLPKKPSLKVPIVKEAPRENDLELRQPDTLKIHDEFEDHDDSRQDHDEKPSGGFAKLLQIFKELVRGLKSSKNSQDSQDSQEAP